VFYRVAPEYHDSTGGRGGGRKECWIHGLRDQSRYSRSAGQAVRIRFPENDGGHGLVARGVVTAVQAIAKTPGIARQTPRVSITVKRTALAARSLGRPELKSFTDWKDGRPETELNFKFYRQATNKIVGLSEVAATFLEGFTPKVPVAQD
jgi:hypothetical protein